jgi:hypothetical protein
MDYDDRSTSSICYLGSSDVKFTCAVFHPVQCWIASRSKHKAMLLVRDYASSKTVVRINIAAVVETAASSTGISVSEIRDDVALVHAAFVGQAYIAVNYWIQQTRWGLASGSVVSSADRTIVGHDNKLAAIDLKGTMRQLKASVPDEALLLVVDQLAVVLVGPLGTGAAEDAAPWAAVSPQGRTRLFSAALPLYLHTAKAVRGAREPQLAVVLGTKDGGLTLWHAFAAQRGICDPQTPLATAHTSAITALCLLNLLESSLDKSEKDEMATLQLLVGSASGSVSRVDVQVITSLALRPVRSDPKGAEGSSRTPQQPLVFPTATGIVRSVVKYVIRGAHGGLVRSVIPAADGTQFLSMSPADGVTLWDCQEGAQLNSIAWKGSNLGAALVDGAEPLSMALRPAKEHHARAAGSSIPSVLRVFTSKAHQLEIGLESIATDMLTPFLLLNQVWLKQHSSNAGVSSGRSKSKLSTGDVSMFLSTCCATLDGYTVTGSTAEAAIKTLSSSSAFRVYSVEPHPAFPRRTAYATNAGLIVVSECRTLCSPPPIVCSCNASSATGFTAELLEAPPSAPLTIAVVRSQLEALAAGCRQTVYAEADQAVCERSLCLPPNSSAVRFLALSSCGSVLACATAAEVLLFAASDFSGIPVPPLPACAQVGAGVTWTNVLGAEEENILCLAIAASGEQQLVVATLSCRDPSAAACMTTISISAPHAAGSPGDDGRVKNYAALYGGSILAAILRNPTTGDATTVQLIALEWNPQTAAKGLGSVSARVLYRYSMAEGAGPSTGLAGGWAPRGDALAVVCPSREAVEICALKPLGEVSDLSSTSDVEFATWTFSLAPFSLCRTHAERALEARGGGWSFSFLSAAEADDNFVICSPSHIFLMTLSRLSDIDSPLHHSAVVAVVLLRQIPLPSLGPALLSHPVRFGDAALNVASLAGAFGGLANNETTMLMTATSGDHFIVSLQSS